MKKTLVITGLSLLALLALFLYLVFSGLMFLYRSEKKIEEKLLARTPLGTSLEEVRRYLEGTDFRIRSDSSIGESRLNLSTPRYSKEGDHKIDVHLGDYQGIPWEVDVLAIWVFKNDVLIEIVAWKEYHGL